MNTTRRSGRRIHKRRALVIVNPQATSVSARLKNLVMYALQGRYEVEAIDTEARSDATLIGLETRNASYDLIVAFGGDGTFNEVVNAFAGTGVPVSILPGGSANVACRSLGIPTDVIDATESLLAQPDDWRPRQVDVGKVDGRHFFSSCGAGFDAALIRRLDGHARLRSMLGTFFVGWIAIATYYQSYLARPIDLQVRTADGVKRRCISAVTQNADPLFYRGERPIRICENLALDDGKLAIGTLEPLKQRDLAAIGARLIASRPGSRHRRIAQLGNVTAATIGSLSTDSDGQLRPFPVQVDGEYIGLKTQMTVRVEPGELTVIG